MGLFKKSKDTGQGEEEIRVETVIDLAPLLKEISPEAPSGAEDLRSDSAFVDIEINIKGTPEHEFGGKIVQEASEPNWRKIQKAAVKLSDRTHDLRVAMFLTRALLHTGGIGGLFTGIELICGLVERYWDTLYPQLNPADNNDPIERVNILSALSEGEDITAPLSKTTLFSPRPHVQFSLRDIRIASGKLKVPDAQRNSAPGLAMIKEALKDCDIDDLQATRAIINSSVIGLNRLNNLLIEKVGSSRAPDNKNLRTVLHEMKNFLEARLNKLAPSPRMKPDKKIKAEKADKSSMIKLAGKHSNQVDTGMNMINNRRDVIRMLDQICTYYDESEPASPVPLLLKRARQLVEKNFIEIVQDLAPESVAQIEKIITGVKDDKS